MQCSNSLVQVLDKGKGAAVTVSVDCKDKNTGKLLFENELTMFIRGSGGFGGKKTGKGAPLSQQQPRHRNTDVFVCFNRPRGCDSRQRPAQAEA